MTEGEIEGKRKKDLKMWRRSIFGIIIVHYYIIKPSPMLASSSLLCLVVLTCVGFCCRLVQLNPPARKNIIESLRSDKKLSELQSQSH